MLSWLRALRASYRKARPAWSPRSFNSSIEFLSFLPALLKVALFRRFYFRCFSSTSACRYASFIHRRITLRSFFLFSVICEISPIEPVDDIMESWEYFLYLSALCCEAALFCTLNSQSLVISCTDCLNLAFVDSNSTDWFILRCFSLYSISSERLYT